MSEKYHETILILDPKTDAQKVINRYADLLILHSVDDPDIGVYVQDEGLRELAYDVRGFRQGYYIALYYKPKNKDWVNTELEVKLRKDPEVLKFLTVRDVDISSQTFSKTVFKSDVTEQIDNKYINAWDVLFGDAKYNT